MLPICLITKCAAFIKILSIYFIDYKKYVNILRSDVLPSHLTPCAVKPQRKLAHSSHQFSPLNVCNLKLCAFRYLNSNGLSSSIGVRSNVFLTSLSTSTILFSFLWKIGLDLLDALESKMFIYFVNKEHLIIRN